MTPDAIRLVQTSWATLAPGAPVIAALFYDRLFVLDPSLRRLFAHADMTAQGRKLTDVLGTVVASLERFDDVLVKVEALGRRHVGYGVTDAHYATVGQALLDTLTAGLGPAFTPETRQAWAQAYAALADVMRRAAAEPSTPVSR